VSVIFVYVTASSADEAMSIGRAAVQRGLAACANIVPQTKSIYRWEGKVEETDEILLLLKTTADHFTALSGLVRSMHSYKTPCIAAVPVTHVDASYAAWIGGAVTTGGSG